MSGPSSDLEIAESYSLEATLWAASSNHSGSCRQRRTLALCSTIVSYSATRSASSRRSSVEMVPSLFLCPRSFNRCTCAICSSQNSSCSPFGSEPANRTKSSSLLLPPPKRHPRLPRGGRHGVEGLPGGADGVIAGLALDHDADLDGDEAVVAGPG